MRVDRAKFKGESPSLRGDYPDVKGFTGEFLLLAPRSILI